MIRKTLVIDEMILNMYNCMNDYMKRIKDAKD